MIPIAAQSITNLRLILSKRRTINRQETIVPIRPITQSQIQKCPESRYVQSQSYDWPESFYNRIIIKFWLIKIAIQSISIIWVAYSSMLRLVSDKTSIRRAPGQWHVQKNYWKTRIIIYKYSVAESILFLTNFFIQPLFLYNHTFGKNTIF